MKLFQRLLVAPAALGLMAPVAVNADTAFTSTTTLTGNAFFTVGSVDDGDNQDENDELHMQYAYGLDLNSSFTGEDLFYAGIETGNAEGPLDAMDSAVNDNASTLNNGWSMEGYLKLHSLWYSFPVGDLTVTAGPLVDQDDVVAATTSQYSDDFVLGAMPFSLLGDETGPGVAVSYAGDNGFVASVSYVSEDGADSGLGIGGDDADDVVTFTVGYNGDGFGGGLVLTSNDGDNAIQASHGGWYGHGNDVGEYDTFGGGIYYSPESFPATISVTYDTVDADDIGVEASDFFIGIDYEVGPGTLSAAYNTTNVEDNDDEDTAGFEVSYTYAINDNITITPGFFNVENDEDDDDTGIVLETAFSF